MTTDHKEIYVTGRYVSYADDQYRTDKGKLISVKDAPGYTRYVLPALDRMGGEVDVEGLIAEHYDLACLDDYLNISPREAIKLGIKGTIMNLAKTGRINGGRE